LTAFSKDDRVRVVILSGAGGKAFVSGADISKFEKERGTFDATQHYNARIKVVYNTIENYAKPTIAMIDGHCIGGGLNLASCTDFRIASTKSRFAMPAAKLALGYPFDAIRRLVAGNAPLTIQAMKFIATQVMHPDPSARDLAQCDKMVAACFASDDYVEGRKAFMEKRKPQFKGK